MDNKDITLQKVINIYQPKIETLLNIWMELGHNETVIEQRCNSIVTHSNNLLNDMVEEAETEKASILDNIEKSLKKIYALRQRLRIIGAMEGYEDTPYVILVTEMQNKIKELENDIQSRMKHINKLIHEELELCRTLGITPKKLPTKPLPTEDELHDFETYIEKLKQQVFDLEEEFIQIKDDVAQMLKDLGKTAILDFEREVILSEDKDFLLTDENMNKLRQWQNSLNNEVQERRGHINELRQKLVSLWELMDESVQYRSKFSNEIEGIGEQTLLKLNNEIVRCEEKKKAHMKIFIDKYRKEIEECWEKCLYGSKQKSDFVSLYKSDVYTNDLLMLHELQLDKLKQYYTDNKKIFELFNKREELWQRTVYLSERANCPNRFKNRGGELLKEEKERKEVNLQLPQIEKTLLEEVKLYKIRHQTDFIIHDKNLEDILEEDVVKFKTNLNAKLSAKKKARDITVTPNQNGKSLLRPTTPTPNITGTKRKALQLTSTNTCDRKLPATSLKRSKLKNTSPRARTLPKIKLNNQTIGKVSYSVRRQLCSTKRLSKEVSLRKKIRKSNQMPPESDVLYTHFKGGVKSRSSTFPKQKENKTPQKTVPRSPRTPHTPKGCTKLQTASPFPMLF